MHPLAPLAAITAALRALASRAAVRMGALALALLFVALAAPPAGSDATLIHARPAAQASPTPRALPDPDAPCGLEATRSIWPTVVEVGQPVTVTVDIGYDCAQEPSPASDVLLVLEDTTALLDADLPADERARQLAAFRDGLHALVDRVTANPASRIGLIDGATTATLAELSATGSDRVRTAIDGLDASAACHRRTATLRAALRMLDAAEPFDTPPHVIYLATDVLPCADGGVVPPPDPPEFGEACDALRDRSIVLWIDHTGMPGRMCRQPGWYYRGNADGNALPEILADIAYRLYDAGRPASMTYDEVLDTLHFEYVIGSGRPAPDSTGQWQLPAEAPAARHAIQFRLTPRNPGIHPVALPPGPALTLSTRTSETTYHLPNPAICVHRPNQRAADCPDWPDPGPQPTPLPTPTPTPPASPTASPTAVPSSAPVSSPSPVPSATTDPQRPIHLYFPRAISSS